MAETMHQELHWKQPRRVLLIRHRVAEKKRAGGKWLLECPGYLFQALVTNRPARAAELSESWGISFERIVIRAGRVAVYSRLYFWLMVTGSSPLIESSLSTTTD